MRSESGVTNRSFDVTPFLTQVEGQHFDRKSMLEGPPGAKRARDRREMRRQAAEYVAAFANADGGVLLLGVEDDGSVTGHQLPPEAVDALLAAPRTRLDPPQPPGFTVSHAGVELIVFDVPAEDVPVQMVDNGFPLRVGDKTIRARETQIAAAKRQGMYESWESRRSSCSLEDLDPELLARARAGAGLSALSDDEYLLRRKLADRRGRRIVLRKAAELLFARYDPDHPNAGRPRISRHRNRAAVRCGAQRRGTASHRGRSVAGARRSSRSCLGIAATPLPSGRHAFPGDAGVS